MNDKSQKTILLVEDEFLISMTEKVRLGKYGWDVIVAGTEEKAVAAFKEGHAIDLVLMDINLGSGIDGMERAEARRLQPHYIESFFVQAFARLGGTMRQREPQRYEISPVPAIVRSRDRQIGLRGGRGREDEERTSPPPL
jgi:CheY-like chemotaxis protein